MYEILQDEELLKLILELWEIKSMKAGVKSSALAGLAVGVATTVGGLLFGSKGIAAGGVVGGIAASCMAGDTFKSVAEIIKDDLTDEQRERLIKLLKKHLLLKIPYLTLEYLQKYMRRDIKKDLVKIIADFLKECGFNIPKDLVQSSHSSTYYN